MPIARNVCRLCLSTKELVLVFDERLNQKIDMKNVIFLTTGVEILDTDLISQKICSTCQQVTEKVHQFRQRAQKTDKFLKDQLCEEIKKIPDRKVTAKVSNADAITSIGANTEKKSPISEKKLPVIATTSVNEINNKPDRPQVEIECLDIQEVTSKSDVPVADEKNVEAPSTPCVQKDGSSSETPSDLLDINPSSSPSRSEETEEEPIQWASKDVADNSTNTKVTVDDSVKNLFSKHPNLKLPNFALNYNYHPFVSLEIDFVEEYFQRNNLNMSKQVKCSIKNYKKSLKQIANDSETTPRVCDNPVKKPKKSKSKHKKSDESSKMQQSLEELATKQDDVESPTLMDTLKLLPKENVIRCNICNLPLSDEDSLVLHKKQHLQCPSCKTEFDSLASRNEHDNQCLVKRCLDSEVTVDLTRLDRKKLDKYSNETIEISDDEAVPTPSIPVETVSNQYRSSTSIIRPVVEISDNNLLTNLDSSVHESILLKELVKNIKKKSISHSTPFQHSSPPVVEHTKQKTAKIKSLVSLLNNYNRVPVEVKRGKFSVSFVATKNIPKKRKVFNISSEPIDVKSNKFFNANNFRQRVKTGICLFAKEFKQLSNEKRTNDSESPNKTAFCNTPNKRSGTMRTYSTKKIKTQNNSIPVDSVTTTNVQSPSLPVKNNQTLTPAKDTSTNNVVVEQIPMCPETIDLTVSEKACDIFQRSPVSIKITENEFDRFQRSAIASKQITENDFDRFQSVSSVEANYISLNNVEAPQIQKPSSLKPLNDSKLSPKARTEIENKLAKIVETNYNTKIKPIFNNRSAPKVYKKKQSNKSQIPDNAVSSEVFQPKVTSNIPVPSNIHFQSPTNNSPNCKPKSKTNILKTILNESHISQKQSQPGVSTTSHDIVELNKITSKETTKQGPKMNSQSLPINKPKMKNKIHFNKLQLPAKSSKPTQQQVSPNSINSHVSQNAAMPQISTSTDSNVLNLSQMSANTITKNQSNLLQLPAKYSKPPSQASSNSINSHVSQNTAMPQTSTSTDSNVLNLSQRSTNTITKNQSNLLQLPGKSSKPSPPQAPSNSINSQNTAMPQISTTDSNLPQMSANATTSTAAAAPSPYIAQFNTWILNNYQNFGVTVNTPQYLVPTYPTIPQNTNQNFNVNAASTLQTNSPTYPCYRQINDTGSVVTQNHLNYMPQTIQAFPTKSPNVMNQPVSTHHRHPPPYILLKAPNADKASKKPPPYPSCSGPSNSVRASGMSQINSSNLPQSTPNSLPTLSNLSQTTIQPVYTGVNTQNRGAIPNLSTSSTSQNNRRYLNLNDREHQYNQTAPKDPNLIRSKFKVLVVPNQTNISIANEQDSVRATQASTSSTITTANEQQRVRAAQSSASITISTVNEQQRIRAAQTSASSTITTANEQQIVRAAQSSASITISPVNEQQRVRAAETSASVTISTVNEQQRAAEISPSRTTISLETELPKLTPIAQMFRQTKNCKRVQKNQSLSDFTKSTTWSNNTSLQYNFVDNRVDGTTINKNGTYNSSINEGQKNTTFLRVKNLQDLK
ncbi:unnamed protein product [Phyllotreta striolata]|uniref:C2H2-type domain-containing protein n=1 Tax=Phyllotreta striolata TaxID=444603 RepID=A0A9N9TKB8_PHYSR|nr:unnamed protein product [Phyllotreta striolata]